MVDISKHDDALLLTFDDGKANAVGHDFIDGMNAGLDQAERDAQAVVITGRPGLFSAGFDLKEFEKGADATTALVSKGAHMLLRLFTHPQPAIVACPGHAVAAGGFMLLAADTRIGAAGDFKIGLNETAIGMTLPVFGLQLAAARLSMRHQTACAIQGQLIDPETAVDAGFLDQVVAPEAVQATALEQANQLGSLPAAAYAGNKLAVRQPYIDTIKASLG